MGNGLPDQLRPLFLQVFNYQTGTVWRQTNPLPGPRSGGKGVALAGEISSLAYLDLEYLLSCLGSQEWYILWEELLDFQDSQPFFPGTQCQVPTDKEKPACHNMRLANNYRDLE